MLGPATTQRIAFFLPAHNEAKNLPAVLRRAASYLDDATLTYRLIVVDDGSTDDTVAVVEALVDEVPHLQLVQHGRNLGYGAALRTGLAESVRIDVDWIAFCDADGQFDPADVGLLLAAADRYGADAVVGYRAYRADGLKRRIMGRAWHLISQRTLGFHTRDVDCGFKLFRAEAIRAIAPQLHGQYAAISPEILIRLQMKGFAIAEVGVAHSPRILGEQSGASWHVVWTSIRELIALRRDLREEVNHADTRIVYHSISSTDRARI